MSEETRTHYLTPTYQSVLISAIQAVREGLAKGESDTTWLATQALFTMLAPDVKKKLQSDYDKIGESLQYAQARNRFHDELIQQINQVDAITAILLRKNRMFIEKAVSVLFLDGYLEKQSIAPLGHEIS